MSRSVRLALLLACLALPALAQEKRLGLGQPLSEREIAGWAISVRPDGTGLPPGRGTVKAGEAIYQDKCASCHGDFGEGTGRWPAMAGGNGSLAAEEPLKTVGSYWPFATTLFDYIRRTMPWGDAQSLSVDETYAVTAYVLHLNDLLDAKAELSQVSLPQVKMPNAGAFHDDDREQAEKAFWQPPCMANCLATPPKVLSRARPLEGAPPKAD